MASDPGTDFHCTDDIDGNLSTVSGNKCLAEALVRRWSTPSGSLWCDGDYGRDLKQYLMAPAFSKYEMQSAATDEALKDERVNSIRVTVDDSQLSNLQSVAVTASIDAADGPFKLTVSVSSLTVDMINFSESS